MLQKQSMSTVLIRCLIVFVWNSCGFYLLSPKALTFCSSHLCMFCSEKVYLFNNNFHFIRYFLFFIDYLYVVKFVWYLKCQKGEKSYNLKLYIYTR